MRRIYLDYNASTPIDPAVAAAMRPFLEDHFGNPSSGHWAATPAKAAIEKARGQVAALLGCHERRDRLHERGQRGQQPGPQGRGLGAEGKGRPHRHQHGRAPGDPRTLPIPESAAAASVSFVPVDGAGRVDPDDVRRAITPKTVLVSIMHANNEVGTIQPIEEIGRITRDHGILLHTDAAQSVGKIATNVDALGVDLLTIAGHKVYAPKGVGALYVRRGASIEPLIHGAGHEGGRRAGTESAAVGCRAWRRLRAGWRS